MSKTGKSKRWMAMWQDILNTIRANGTTVTNELWISLAFMTEGGLSNICRELHIQVPPRTIH